MHDLARRLGGKRGPKKRVIGGLPEDTPTKEEWETYIQGKGPEGGYEAKMMDEEEHMWW